MAAAEQRSYHLTMIERPRTLPSSQTAEALGHGVVVLSPALVSYFLRKQFTVRVPAPAGLGSEG